jgi:mannan endo-1,4-beta-mannosidase
MLLIQPRQDVGDRSLKKNAFSWIASLVLLSLSAAFSADGFGDFITRNGDRLMEGNRGFRFISYNIPCLHYNEDAMEFDRISPWRLPDAFEIEDALESINQTGGLTARTYTLSVRKKEDPDSLPRHVLAPGRFNEEAFRTLDRVLVTAGQKGVRLIIPFVDNWSWWGGIAEYAAFRGKSREAFWTDPQIIGDFKETIRYVLNRRNSLSGTAYRDEKAVLAWETGNELQCPPEWTRSIAAYVKSLDANHLVMDGFHTTKLRDESIDDPNVDIVTTHHYPNNALEMIEQIRGNRDRSRGIKPYVIGEFGFVPTEGIAQFLDAVINEGISGALIWSLRYHNRDGGFYWHSEPFGGDLYKSYHWPGFSSGAAYDETALVRMMRKKAFEIRSLPEPPPGLPVPPRLLPIDDSGSISWQGSAGASGYRVERSGGREGPWKIIAENVSDADAPYLPLFNDGSAEIGGLFFYRVRAENGAGVSEPSNAVGPVAVRFLSMTDAMTGFGGMHSTGGAPALVTSESRKAKEDFDRIRGEAGSELVYEVPGPILSWDMNVFFPGKIADFQFSLSEDGREFRPAPAGRTDYFEGEKEYGYWKPVRYSGSAPSKRARFFRIEFRAAAQIARVEVRYGK